LDVDRSRRQRLGRTAHRRRIGRARARHPPVPLRARHSRAMRGRRFPESRPVGDRPRDRLRLRDRCRHPPRVAPGRRRGRHVPHQLAVIRDILAECQGVVQWGGSFRRPHESHVQIDVTPTDPRLKKVVDRIRGWSDFPAGAPESWQWAPDRRFSPAGGALPSSWLPLHLQHLPGLHFGW
jgi:hypothetical protein